MSNKTGSEKSGAVDRVKGPGRPRKAAADKPSSIRTPEERREEIAGAALKLFSEIGFNSVTNKDLGREANVAPGLIYYYFKDKDDLFTYVLQKALNDTTNHYEHLQQEAAGSRLDDWVKTNISLSGPISRFLKIMLDYALSERRTAPTDAAIHRFYETETGVLAAAITEELAPSRESASDLALLVSVFLDGLMAAQIMRPDTKLDHLVDLLLRLVRESEA